MSQDEPHELPQVPRPHLRLDTGALVPPDHGLGFWWTIDDFLDTKPSWIPQTCLRIRRFPVPGAPGYIM